MLGWAINSLEWSVAIINIDWNSNEHVFFVHQNAVCSLRTFELWLIKLTLTSNSTSIGVAQNSNEWQDFLLYHKQNSQQPPQKVSQSLEWLCRAAFCFWAIWPRERCKFDFGAAGYSRRRAAHTRRRRLRLRADGEIDGCGRSRERKIHPSAAFALSARLCALRLIAFPRLKIMAHASLLLNYEREQLQPPELIWSINPHCAESPLVIFPAPPRVLCTPQANSFANILKPGIYNIKFHANISNLKHLPTYF